jgi:hypothetical protein
MMMLIVREHGPNDTLAMLLVAYLLLLSYVPSERAAKSRPTSESASLQ